jgi:hypothetical protein
MSVEKQRFRVWLVGVSVLLSMVGPVWGQTLTLTAKPTSELLDDVEYVIKAAAPEDAQWAQGALNTLSRIKSGAMLKGLDRSRSVGLAITVPQNVGPTVPPSIVAAVPVTNFSQFLGSLRELGLMVDDQPGAPGFSHKLTGADPNRPIFILHAKRYAFLSISPSGADRIPAMDPSSWRSKARPETAVSLKVRLSEVPEALRAQFLDRLAARQQAINQQRPGENDAEYRGRMAGERLVTDTVEALLREGDAISIDLDVNRRSQQIALDVAVSAKPGTSTAKTLRALNGRRSRFQGLSKDAPLASWINLPVATGLREVIAQTVKESLKESSDRATSASDRKIYARFSELLETNLKATDMDLGVAIREASRGGSPGSARYVLLAGVKVQKGRELERLFKDAGAKLTPGEKDKVAFDVGKAADGTKIHKVSGAGAAGSSPFGAPVGFVAMRDDAILFSIGENSLAPLQRAIDELSTPTKTDRSEPLAAALRVAKLRPLLEIDPTRFRQPVAELLRGADKERDRVDLGLKGDGPGMRMRLVVDVPALKTLVAIASQLN